MNNTNDRHTPKSLDFVPFNGFWGENRETGAKSKGCASGIWEFMQFDVNPISPPKLKQRPSVVPNSMRKSIPDKSLLPTKLRRVPHLIPQLPSAARYRNCFRVGDDETETRVPLSSLSNRQSPKRGRTVKLQQPTKKSIKGAIKSILTPRASNRSQTAGYSTTLNISTTESLSDDDDSIWNEVSPKYAAQRDLSIKYSRRSQISDGSKEQSTKLGDLAKRVLRPNCTHVSASYWTEMNQRPYMEDRIILDRIGSMVVSNTYAKHSCDLGVSKLLEKLESVNTLVNGSPVRANLIPMYQQATSIYGVFDGHAGARASQYCSDWFSCYLRNQQSFHSDLPQALRATFANVDKDFMRTGKNDGTTACVCVVVGNKRVVCANAGDSRAIIVKKDGTFVQLSKDHKPGSAAENKRITDLGGRIIYHGSWRVEGRLAVSRAIGDAPLKPYVTSDPDIFDYVLKPEDWFIVVASDGIWDVLENDQVATMTLSYSCKVKGSTLQVDSNNLKWAAKRICDRARGLGSHDNLSAVVVDLQN